MAQSTQFAKIGVRPLTAADRDEWLRLWDANNNGVRNDAVTNETWSRLLNPIYPVHGLLAHADGKAAGLVHYILHPVTGHIEPVCYMQDLFVDADHRRKGIARALVGQLAATGTVERWARLYWLAEAENAEAQGLYKSLGVKLNFSLHVLPLVHEGTAR